jgi:hypothetical protein
VRVKRVPDDRVRDGIGNCTVGWNEMVSVCARGAANEK